MIKELKSTKEVLPLFHSYMKYMSQFFDIKNYDDWLENQIKYINMYDTEKNRFVYAMYESNKMIGFSFVNDYLKLNAKGLAIAEFYIEPEKQHKGYGAKLAAHIFNEFPGDWEISVIKNNLNAQKFWQSVITTFTKNKFKTHKVPSYDGYVFTFNNA